MMSDLQKKLFKPLIDLLTPSCEIITQKISRSMDEPLSWKERLQIRLHLMACVLCDRYRQQLLAMRELIQEGTGTPEDDSATPESGLSPEAKQRIKEQLSKDSGEA